MNMEFTEDMYSVDITSKSPSVRTYLMEKCLEMLSKVDDAEVERLFRADEAGDSLVEGKTSIVSTGEEEKIDVE